MKRWIRRVLALVLMLCLLVSSASALTVEQALELLELYYVGEIPEEVYDAQDLDSLFDLLGDPYTYYMTAEETDGFLGGLEDVSLVGIGVATTPTQDGVLIAEILPDGSAEQAGLQVGDLIIAIDGMSCVPGNEAFQMMLRGREGSFVHVTVKRNGGIYNYMLMRMPIEIPTVRTSVLDNGLGYLECTSFGSETAEHFRDGLKKYDAQVTGWLVDMRSNTGGITEEASDSIGMFTGGRHIYLQDASGTLYQYASSNFPATRRPIVVLVDGYTASAAESFALGIRDHGRGFLVGTRTYGKGVAQIIVGQAELPEYFEDGGSLKLTAYKLYGAGGTTQNIIGVIPTLLVPDEAAPGVALALLSGPGDGSWMTIGLGDMEAWVDVSGVDPASLAALFEALPPVARLSMDTALGQGEPMSVAEAARQLGVEYNSRWFTDVDDSEFHDEINTLATYGIVHGDGRGHFDPYDTLTRAELCALLGKALGVPGSSRSHFSDVAADDACAPYINAMYELGWIKGVGEDRFDPDGTLSQQEFYTLMARVVRYLNVWADLTAGLLDQASLDWAEEQGAADWAQEALALLYEGEILPDEVIPGAAILREEAAAGMYYMLQSIQVLP